MSNLDDLAASFQSDIDKAKSDDKDKRDLKFAQQVFAEMRALVGISKARVKQLVNDDVPKDFGYGLKYAFSEFAHIHTTSASMANWKDMLQKPITEWPNKIWRHFSVDAVQIAKSHNSQVFALVFRVAKTPWILTSEAVQLPQLSACIRVTTKAGMPELTAIPLTKYVEIKMEKEKDE